MRFFSFFSPKTLGEFNSKVNKKIKVLESGGKKVIYVGGAEQTGGTITGMWRKALSLVQGQILNIQNVLVLGVGGGDVIRLIHKINSQIVITAVDLDPVMINIAKNYFNLSGLSNIKIHQKDAFYFLLLNKKKYDFIIVDLFIGFKNPQKFKTPKFLKMLKNNLEHNGFIIYNSHYHFDINSEFEEFHAICNKIFSKVEILINYPYSRILLLK